MPAPTIPARLFEQAKNNGTAPAYSVREASGWVSTSWSQYADHVRQVARALLALDVKPGQVVCILGNNRPEWVETAMAAMSIGAIPAGIYQTCSPEEIGYILGHAEAPVVLVEDQSQWSKVAEVRGDLSALQHIVTMKGTQVADPSTLSWTDFLAKGGAVAASEVDTLLENLDLESPATFIYTSGTTGPPKAVMLSHKNIAWTANLAMQLVDQNAQDVGLSYLPLSHIAEQMFTIHAPVTSGGQVFFAESIDKMPDNLKEVQPTVFFGVPRVWEKFHAGISTKLSGATGVKKHLVSWAMGVGAKVSAKKNTGENITGLLAFQYRLANKLIFSKLKPALGLGNARICVSGAAPISPDVLEFMASLDVVIHEVYGQSEDCGPTTFNMPGATQFGSVGQRLTDIDVQIAEDGEILIKGPNVFLGYYKDEAATADALDADGWLHSGDLGAFNDEGFLTITGRKKDIIITAGGKNIAPKNIEAALTEHELISQAVVIGDRRKYLCAVVALDPEAAARFSSSDAPHEDPSVVQALEAHVQSINTRFAKVEHVRKFRILPRELDQDNGELTPTMKIKRAIVHDNWSALIDSIYAEDSA